MLPGLWWAYAECGVHFCVWVHCSSQQHCPRAAPSLIYPSLIYPRGQLSFFWVPTALETYLYSITYLTPSLICLTFAFYCFCYKLITKGMLPISLNYTKWPISGSSAFHMIIIKLKYLYLAYRNSLLPHPTTVFSIRTITSWVLEQVLGWSVI